MLTDIKYFFRGLDESVVGRCQTKRGKTGSGKSNQRKARYQHLMVMTHPTIQHAQFNWLTCFEIKVLIHFPVFWSEKITYHMRVLKLPPMCTICETFQTLSDTFQGLSRQLKGRRWCLTVLELKKSGKWETVHMRIEPLLFGEAGRGWKIIQTRLVARMTEKWIPKKRPGKKRYCGPTCGVFQKPINLLVFLSQQVPPTR